MTRRVGWLVVGLKRDDGYRGIERLTWPICLIGSDCEYLDLPGWDILSRDLLHTLEYLQLAQTEYPDAELLFVGRPSKHMNHSSLCRLVELGWDIITPGGEYSATQELAKLRSVIHADMNSNGLWRSRTAARNYLKERSRLKDDDYGIDQLLELEPAQIWAPRGRT